MSGIDEQDRYEERCLKEEKESREERLLRGLTYDAVVFDDISFSLTSADAGDIVFQDEDLLVAFYRGIKLKDYDVVE